MKEKEIVQAAIILLLAVFLVNTLMPFATGVQKPLIVLSGSMTPLMLPGDMIIVRSVDPGELVVGDVLAFQDPGGKPNTLITHRITSIKEEENRTFQTKGDANNAQDDFKVPESKAVGKLVFVIPFAGYLPDTLKHNKNIFIFTVILPAAIIILDEIRNMILYSNPVKARKFEREKKKLARRTSYGIRTGRIIALILISGLIFSGVVAHNLGQTGSVMLEKENTLTNQKSLPMVYVFTPEKFEKKFTINSWYGILTPSNQTQVTAPENIPATVTSVPYILPVFWIVSLAEINPYLPVIFEIGLYTFLATILLFPLWYWKSIIGKKKKKVRIQRLIMQWKRQLHLG